MIAASMLAAGEPRTRFASNVLTADVSWTRAPARWLALGLHGDVQRRDYSSAGVTGGPSVAAVYALPADACALLGLAAGCVDPAILPTASVEP